MTNQSIKHIMKTMKPIYVWLSVFLLSLAAAGCTDEEIVPNNRVEEGLPVNLVLSYNAQDNLKITAGSRATLPEDREKKIYNFYIYIFDSAGNKMYGQYFDSNNLDKTAQSNYWTATNEAFDAGQIFIKTFSANDCSVYAITNIDADMVNISPERLNIIQSKDQLDNLVSTMNQNTVARNGYFPMSAKIGPVNIGAGTQDKTLQFERLDAKILFNVFVGEPATGKQKISEFEPYSWQVINVPTSSFVFQQTASATNKGYFNTEAVNFESKGNTEQKVGQTGGKTPVETYQFSFYMQENETKTTHGTPPTQAARSKRTKNPDGTNGGWIYAPDNATYVVLKGRVVMQNPLPTDPTDKTTVGNTLNAEVTYIIHLGDFNTDKSDYNVVRNTQYTYNVCIRGVDDIRVEVETNKNTEPTENAPGAFGTVTIAKEEIFECDAHYSSHVLTFHAKNIKPDKVTWYVKTPFSEGRPTIVDGSEVPTGLDYKWVHFQVNDRNPDTGNYYEQKRKKYHPDTCMDVIQLVEYLRREAKEYQKDPNSSNHHFDDTKEEDGGPKICVTAHVDEYYYEVNPITGVYEHDLSKRFVNKPMRLMHILSDTEISKDKESLIVGSASTIQQRSIQTIYNANNPDLHSGWGCEYWDEYPKGYKDPAWYYDENGYNDKRSSSGNNDLMNGRLNTCKEWGLCNPTSDVFKTGSLWETYMDFEVENTTPLLKKQYRYLRYSCMTRNRDNNANGKIDEDEVRWYMASIRQLIGIWMGADGISNDARLYTKEGLGEGGAWRQHVISSTARDDNSYNPILVWAEEGSSTGPYNQSYFKDAYTPHQYGPIYSVRCVRNLGEHKGKDITQAPIKVIPTDYIQTIDHNDGSYTLDMTYLNEKSIRYFTSRELDFSDENSMQNRMYTKFHAAKPSANPSNFGSINIQGMNEELDKSLTSNRFCPPGYRLPNQRELTVMYYYLPSSFFSGGKALTRTWYSFGSKGVNKSGSYGFWLDQGNMRVGPPGDASTTQIRCVRDVQ